VIAGIAIGALLLAGGGGGAAAWYFATATVSPAPSAFPPIVGPPPIADPRPPAKQIQERPTASPPLVPLQAVPIEHPPVAGPPAVKRKQSDLPKPWEKVDGGMTKEEIGSLLKDKYDQFRKKLEGLKKDGKDTDSGD
jgi:hypothetical protein